MTRILFVCVHNAGRSQMAEAFFNRLAQERGLDCRAESAGTMRGEQVNAIAAQVMAEAGVSLEGHRPRPLTPGMIAAADRIITMGCGVDVDACPAGMYVTEDWGMDDPHGQSLAVVREIREQVRQRVEVLVTELEGAPAGAQR